MALGKKTGGRQRGVPNKATAEIKSVAQKHGPEAVRVLVSIMKNAKAAAPARVAAAKELLDRAYGKPPQSHTGEGGGPIQHRHVTFGGRYKPQEPPA